MLCHLLEHSRISVYNDHRGSVYSTEKFSILSMCIYKACKSTIIK